MDLVDGVDDPRAKRIHYVHSVHFRPLTILPRLRMAR